jgi:hypothetical protein
MHSLVRPHAVSDIRVKNRLAMPRDVTYYSVHSQSVWWRAYPRT